MITLRQSVELYNQVTVKKTTKVWSIMADLKALFKGVVLIFNVLPVLTGFWLALYFTEASLSLYWKDLVFMVVGSTMIMAGALALNNWYDSDIDALMERTKHRPTVTGKLSTKVVFFIGILLSVLGQVLLLFTTLESAIYAFIGWLTYVVFYTMWSKRRYTLNTIIGSVSGAVTPLIGWAVIEPTTHVVPITLFLILFIWQIPHTLAIAMRKYNEYKAAGVMMLPVVYGFGITKRQMLIYITCLLPLPFLLSALGTVFLVVATGLTVCWMILCIKGFYTKGDKSWATRMFLYSVNYLMILLIMMVIVTVI